MAKDNKKLSKQMEENIKSYANEIVTLESFRDSVIENIGMYIGNKGNTGFINMIREIFQNAIDEVMKHDSPCTRVIISYDERTHTTITEDNGRGIPFDIIERVFTSQHTSSNYTKKPGEYSSGKHGVGSKVTNALSDKFVVESYILGEARRCEFDNFKLSDKGVQVIPNKENKQGTMIMFHPLYEVLGEITVTWQDVYNLVRSILPLTNIGTVIQFNAIAIDGREIHETLVNEDGILTDLIYNTVSPVIKPIAFGDDTGYLKADIAICYDANDMLGSESITNYANFCPMTGGKHVTGFIDGIGRFFCTYMNRIYLAKGPGSKSKSKNKLTVVTNDIKTGLKSIVVVSALKPIFGGQAKNTLENDEMHGFVKDLTIKSLEEWSKQNPADMQKLCAYFKKIAKARTDSDNEKIKISDNVKSTSLSGGLPGKYIPPTGHDNLELWIFEGDSASGGARNKRCKRRQGLMPIKGKIPNAFDTPPAKFMNNDEISGITAIIGGGWGKKFDLSRVPWEKIVFGTDADSDQQSVA